MLARIEKLEGVLDAWTNRPGTRIVISFTAAMPADPMIAAVSSALAPRYRAEEVTGAEAVDAVRACQSGSPEWFRAAAVSDLSREEARVLALQWARRGAESASLEAGQQEMFERLVREGLLRAFAEGEGSEFDPRAFRARCRREIEGAIEALGLPSDRARTLRQALEAEFAALPGPAESPDGR